MKIEMGESLIYSWLRHSVGCQIAQLNWKTASINTERLKTVEELYNIFKEKMQLNSTLPQFLTQAEIDVLGIKTNNNGYEIYAVDIAFHEAGLGYHDSTDRVIKKLLRSALILHNQFDTRTGKLIFACPKIARTTTIEGIINGLADVAALFKQFGFDYTFELICDKDFDTKILGEVIKKSKDIKDTSDLFVRALKLLAMFNDSIGGTALSGTVDNTLPVEAVADVDAPLKTVKDILAHPYSKLLATTELKAGQKAQYFFDKLVADNLLVDFYEKYANVTIQNFPILKEVTNRTPDEIKALKTDDKGRSRYYADIWWQDNRSFILCSQWYDKNLSLLQSYADAIPAE